MQNKGFTLALHAVRKGNIMKKFLLFMLCISLSFIMLSCSKREPSASSQQTTTLQATSTAEYYPTDAEKIEHSSVPTTTKPKSTTITASSAKVTAATTTTKSRIVRVTIPEGFSVSQIGDRLEKNKVCKKSEFLKMVNEYPFDLNRYSLIRALPSTENRPFRLEGYLFPDTYDFYINMMPQDAIGKMLRAAEANIGKIYTYSGISTDQIITLASIIEKEAAKYEDMRKVSSVFHNRLKETTWRLDADSTIHYIEYYVKPNLKEDKNRYNSDYNTYKCIGLPQGPICNPGANALSAAVNPADTDYYFFVTDKKGKFYFAVTLEEHEENLIKAGIIPTTTTTIHPA